MPGAGGSRYHNTTNRERLDKAMHEVFTNKPSTVKPASKGKERKQMLAIAYSKARRGK